MEILFVSHKYPPATGGMEKQSYELINGMSALTKTHHIVYNNQENRIGFFLQLGKRILNVIKEHPGISIIHFNDGLIAAFSMLHVGYRHLKHTVTLHGLDVVFPSMIYQKLIIPKFNRFDLIFAVSSATATACRNRGIESKKIVVVNNGVSNDPKGVKSDFDVSSFLLEQYHTDIKHKKILVAIGRPVKRKGFSWFIKNVMPKLNDDFMLLLIGPLPKEGGIVSKIVNNLPFFLRNKIELFLGASSDEAALKKLLKNNIASKNVIRLGKLSIEQMDAILVITHAFVMPNIEIEGDMEGFGLVCIEAALKGTRVLAAASGGITDAITHGKNGILLPPGHIASWVHHLNLKPDDQSAISLPASDIINYTINRFSWEKMCNEYLLHFINIAQN
ncbi:glycosyltransferase involved in cell wall biosynthesis [Pedobacter sp. UYP24]